MLRINGLHLKKLVTIAYLYDSQSLQCGSVNKRKLLLVIYVQGKNISRKSCIYENILP